MAAPLPQKFYRGDTVDVARALLGKVLVRRDGFAVLAGIITETEAYCGPHDLACHASKGKTARTSVMFGPPGHWYVYLIYGMYHCLNVVTERVDYPAAVLIRGVYSLVGVAEGVRTDGPGKLCRAYGIGKEFNAARAFGRGAVLRVEDRGYRVVEGDITVTPRIGVDYAGEYKDKPWRFLADPGKILG
jgi:DNA-3-methyladenine glycosylase